MKEQHWWIYCPPTGTEKPILVYACPDHGMGETGEDAARVKAMEMLSGYNWQLKRLPTREISAASAYIRGKRLESGEGLRASTQRLGHERSVNRLKQRIAARRAR